MNNSYYILTILYYPTNLRFKLGRLIEILLKYIYIILKVFKIRYNNFEKKSIKYFSPKYLFSHYNSYYDWGHLDLKG